jgi:hypothetical protein
LIETPAGLSYTGTDSQGWMKEGGYRQMRVEHLVGTDVMVIDIRVAYPEEIHTITADMLGLDALNLQVTGRADRSPPVVISTE